MLSGISERFLHFIWQYSLFDKQALFINEGGKLEVISPGLYHHDSGPDFRHAKIKIDNTLWVGNIELHLRSSDWQRHNHQNDKVYSSVILHVVLLHDMEVQDAHGNNIPVLELRNKIPEKVLERWHILNAGMFSIPCAEIGRADVLTMNNWMDRLIVERLESRSGQINDMLKSCGFDWEQAFHVFLFRAMGMGINALPFELLARIISIKFIKQYNQSSFQLEALLFGSSGLLPKETMDPYPQALLKEYQFLSRKHKIQGIEPHLWKFLRMRPVNFPTVRIAQVAGIYSESSISLESLSEIESIKTLIKVLKGKTSEYWNTHYHFQEETDFKKKELGIASARGLLINAIIPILFEYARHRSNQGLRERCLDWLYELRQEDNMVIRQWTHFGVQPSSAAQSQALIQLKRNYCDQRRCLECTIGHRLLKDALH
jgi:hypothetical protein